MLIIGNADGFPPTWRRVRLLKNGLEGQVSLDQIERLPQSLNPGGASFDEIQYKEERSQIGDLQITPRPRVAKYIGQMNMRLSNGSYINPSRKFT